MDRSTRLLRLLRPESMLLYAFLAVLAWAPFPNGSSPAWAELALGAGFGAILFAWSGLALAGLTTTPLPVRRIAVPALCIAATLGWAAAQSLDLHSVAGLTGIDLRALAHPIWSMTSDALGRDVGAYLSVDPERTRHAIFTTALGVGAFLVAFELARDRDRAFLLLAGAVLVAVAYALAAIAGLYLEYDPQTLVTLRARAATDVAVGPFGDASHFATFMSIGALAAMGLFVETLRQSVTWDRGWRAMLRTMVQTFGGASALWLAAVAIVVAALVLTQSRGIVAFLIGALALVIALAAGRRWSAGEEAGQRAMTALLVAILGVVVALAMEPLSGRTTTQGVDESTRAALAETSMKAIAAAPLVGHGFGAFQRYHVLFDDGSLSGDVDGVHNELLETLADLGLPAGLAFIAAPVILAGMCFAGCVRRRRDRMYPAIGFAITAAVVVHALVEFSLQIPAIAVVYAALLGLGVAQSWRTSMDAVR